jgi:4-hydroxybenzoyl-CoA thioesterase
MFEVKLQTYWGDSDAVGIVFFPNYFKFVAQAEEEFYRAVGIMKDRLMDQHQLWLPRVEVFAKFTFPVRNGAAIIVRLNPSFPGEKSVRYDFEIQDEKGRSVSEGYVTAVCVDRATFEPKAIPEVIRNAIATLQ